MLHSVSKAILLQRNNSSNDEKPDNAEDAKVFIA